MTWLIIGLILWFGGNLLVKATGADKPSFLCRQCMRITRGSDSCPYCGSVGPEIAVNEHLNLSLDLKFYGERTLIVRTLKELSAEMKRLVDRSALSEAARSRVRADSANSAQDILPRISELSAHLAMVFADAQARFDESASVEGSPRMFCDAYAYLLGEIVEAQQILAGAKAPPNLDATAHAFRNILRSIRAQLASWPATLDAAAEGVSGDTYRGTLIVACDLTPFYLALAAKTGHVPNLQTAMK